MSAMATTTDPLLERIERENWILIDIEGIQISRLHACYRKVYAIKKNGDSRLCFETIPCMQYHDLQGKYQKAFRYCEREVHRLEYKPKNAWIRCYETKNRVKWFMDKGCRLLLYKGGTIELQLAKDIVCDSINIEDVGVKKAHSHDPGTEVHDYWYQLDDIVRKYKKAKTKDGGITATNN